MRIEEKTSTRPASGRARSRSLLVFAILAAGAVLAAYSVALILGGMLIFRSVQDEFSNGGPRMPLKAVPVHLLSAAKNHVAALRSNAEPWDLVHLDIKFKHLEKIRDKRDEAMAKGVLMAADGDFVPAKIRHDGRSIDVKIRLKGDALDHLSGDKWSFRVKVGGGDQLFGMRRFSIQAPRVRDFQAEPIFLKHLRDNGILTPRYRFVNVSVNGKNIGAMAVEEHFSKELLESQERREGVILRFDESDFWRNLALNGTFGPFGNPHVAILTPFGSSKVAESPALQSDFATAVGLMRGFLAGDLSPDEVFEVELMARFMAICEVWRTSHPIAWHNLRFYFNPLTSRLEPVGFDGNIQMAPLRPGLVTVEGGFTPMLLADGPFREVFTRELARIATEMGDGTVEAWARPIETALVPQLQEGFGWIESMRFESLVPRAKKLASITRENFELFLPPLGDPDMRFPDPIRIYLCEDCGTSRIEIVNNLPVPVRVHSMTFTRKKGVPASLPEPIARSTFPIEIPATKSMQIPSPVYVELESGANVASFKVEGVAQVNGQPEEHTVLARPYYDAIDASPLPDVTLEQALQTHEFLRASDDQKSVLVSPGVWEVMAPLIIPNGLGLTISAGTELRFPEGGILVSSGPLRFEGTAERPVRLAPIAGSDSWGGLVSWRSDSPHLWRHVVIERTSGFSRVGWRLTGGVTLRRAEIEISDSLFVGNRSEDALNMIRSRFELVDVEFRDASSDALDADFSDGVIRRGRFVQIGGDGIDVSGAKIEVDGTILTDISDKAISVGEASQLTARNVEIERVGTGAASKDASELVFEDSTVKGATMAGVSVYTKKPVFGPARARVERVQMENVAMPALVQAGSSATIDGVAVEAQPFDTDILY